MGHGRKPPPPRRTGRTRSTIDSCPAALFIGFMGFVGLVAGAALVVVALA